MYSRVKRKRRPSVKDMYGIPTNDSGSDSDSSSSESKYCWVCERSGVCLSETLKMLFPCLVLDIIGDQDAEITLKLGNGNILENIKRLQSLNPTRWCMFRTLIVIDSTLCLYKWSLSLVYCCWVCERSGVCLLAVISNMLFPRLVLGIIGDQYAEIKSWKTLQSLNLTCWCMWSQNPWLFQYIY